MISGIRSEGQEKQNREGGRANIRIGYKVDHIGAFNSAWLESFTRNLQNEFKRPHEARKVKARTCCQRMPAIPCGGFDLIFEYSFVWILSLF